MMFLFYFLWLFQPSFANELKPKLQEITLPKDLGQQIIRLNCDLLEGLQPLVFEWYHNNNRLENNNKTTIKIRDDSANLIIKSKLTVDDLGEYKCIVKNSYGQDVQKVSLYSPGKIVINFIF